MKKSKAPRLLNKKNITVGKLIAASSPKMKKYMVDLLVTKFGLTRKKAASVLDAS
jgi:hypothetical protein